MTRLPSSFSGLPMPARVYVAIIIAAGAVAAVVALAGLRVNDSVHALVLLALAVATSAAKIDMSLGRRESSLSLSHAVNFWALLTLSPAEAVLIAMTGAWGQCTIRVRQRNPPHRTLFSIAALACTTAAAAPIVAALLPAGATSLMAYGRAALAAAPVYYVLNSAIVAGAVSLSNGQSFRGLWDRHYLWSAPSYFAGAGVAAMAATASAHGAYDWLALLAMLLYLLFRSYNAIVARLEDERAQTAQAMDVQLATIKALALAIEAKGGCSPAHIPIMQRYAVRLAEAAGMSEADVQAVRMAALLHDIGNLAVPEHILSKQDPLTPEEFERVKIHPRVASEILVHVPFPVPVAPLVLAHQERWDGTGYPSGLRGDAIPLGARVLAIADTYSVIRSDRPHRASRSHDLAIQEVRCGAGTAFDPALVDLFVTLLEAEETQAAGDGLLDQAAHATGALGDIASTHREAQALYEIALALGSSLEVAPTMSMIAAKLSRLVPFTTCALFLGDDERGYLCRLAVGPGAEALQDWTPRRWADLARAVPPYETDRLKSMLPARLALEDGDIGALVIYHTTAKVYSDEHRRVLARVGGPAAAVLFNSLRFEQTQHESQTDVLTGLPNRRALERSYRAIAQSVNADDSLTLVVLDLDRLKQINDDYGHDVGDRALRTVATLLRAGIRTRDVCARYAGDEFVLLLRDCDPGHEARRIAALQAAVANHPFEFSPGVHGQLSISAGAARFPADGASFDELLAVADNRMYRDKARGRNIGRFLHDVEPEVVGT